MSNDNTPNDKENTMASAENPNTTPVDAAIVAEHHALLDMDLPAQPEQAPIPAFVLAVLTAIRAIFVGTTLATCEAAFAALKTAIQPAQGWAEGPHKVMVRNEKDLKLAAIKKVEAGLKLQAQLAASMSLAPPADAPIVVEEAVVAAPPAAPPTKRLNASFTKIQKGDLRGEWGICVYDGQPKVGDTVIAHRKSNGQQQLKQITKILYTSPYGIVCDSIDLKEPKAPKATKAASVAPIVAQVAALAGDTVDETAYDTAPPSGETGTLFEAIGNIAGEAANNASVEALGSMAGGQLRGVGFSTAEGYVTALAHGVKAATAESYKYTLRHSYGYTLEQLAALTVTIIPEAVLPVGKGIVHRVTNGKAVSEMSRDEVRAHMAATSPGAVAKAEAEAKAKAEEAARQAIAADLKVTLIAGLVESGHGLIVSPGRAVRAVSTPYIELHTALASIGRTDMMPKLKSNKSQFGEVMGLFNGRGLKSWAVTRHTVKALGETWPENVVSRWIVGHLDGSAQLGKLGDKELVAELHQDNTIHFIGGSDTIRERVISEFEARRADETLDSSYLLAWFRDKLTSEFHAVANGGFQFIPGRKDQTVGCAAFIATVKPLLGRPVGLGETVNAASMVDDIAVNLDAEFQAVQKSYDDAMAAVASNARKAAAKAKLDDAAQEAAAKAARITSDVAGERLKMLDAVEVRVKGFTPMLLDKAKPVQARIAALRATLMGYCSDATLRAFNLELDLDA